MPWVLYVDTQGVVRHNPPPASTNGDSKQLNADKLSSQQTQPPLKQGASYLIVERTAEPASSGRVHVSYPVPTPHIIATSLLHRPLQRDGSKTQGQMPGLSSIPDTVLGTIVQHLDKQSQLKLSYTCRALAQAVFRCQLKQARLMLHDPRCKWEGLLSVLTWLPISSMSLGWTGWDEEEQDVRLTATPNAEKMLDSILGLTQESILGSVFASLSGLKGWKAACLWNRNFSGGSWRSCVRYDSIVNVTLKGMRLAFVVPPALAHACPNIQLLTLESCKIYGMVKPYSTLENPATLTVTAGDGYAQHLVQQLVAETTCSSLTELNLIDCRPAAHPDSPDLQLQADCLRINLPNVRKLSLIDSLFTAPNLLHAWSSKLEVLSMSVSVGARPKGELPYLNVSVMLVNQCSQLHTLSIPDVTVTGPDFEWFFKMPNLKHLTAKDAHFRETDDCSSSSHLDSLYLQNDVFELTTLGRLPLCSLKDDPISKRQKLEIRLPVKFSTMTELDRAICNLKGCCPNGVAAVNVALETCCFEAGNIGEKQLADILQQLLATLKPKSDLRLTWATITHTTLKSFNNCEEVKSLTLDRCSYPMDCNDCLQGILQRLPSLTQLTFQQLPSDVHDLLMLTAIYLGAREVHPAVNHKQPLNVVVGPVAITADELRSHLLNLVPPAFTVKLHEEAITNYEDREAPKKRAWGEGIKIVADEPVPLTLPAIVMTIAEPV